MSNNNNIVKGTVKSVSGYTAKVEILLYYGTNSVDADIACDNISTGDVVFIAFENGDEQHPIIIAKYNKSSSKSSTEHVQNNGNIKSLVSLADSIIHSQEGSYDDINGNDNGAISIGKIQWHGDRAKSLLSDIRDKGGSGFDSSIDLSSSWSSFIVSEGSGAYNTIKTILGTDISKSVQDETALSDVQGYIDYAISELDLHDNASIIYAADIINQYGSGGASRLLSGYSENPDSEGCLEDIHNYVLNNGGGTYKTRRTNVYEAIKVYRDEGKLKGTDGDLTASTSFDGSDFIWPLPGFSIITSPYDVRTDPFGGTTTEFHNGIDISGYNVMGSSVVASASGTIEIADNDETTGYGKYIQIDHGNGYKTRYGHSSELKVSVGDSVNQGDEIMLVGSTGRSTGAHLHFEIRKDGNTVDPLEYVTAPE